MNLDLGLDDLDFLSVSRSASMSYPSIHFGDEDGKDSSKRPSPTKSASPEARLELNREDTIEPEDAKPKTRLVRTLYIQVRNLFVALVPIADQRVTRWSISKGRL